MEMRNIIGNWKKGNPYYKVTEFLAEVLFVGLKLSLVSGTLGYLVEEISKPSGNSTAWVLLAAYKKFERI